MPIRTNEKQIQMRIIYSFKAVDGGYTEWSESKYSVTCGGGVKTLTRTCTNPPPSRDGRTAVNLDQLKRHLHVTNKNAVSIFVTAFCRSSPVILEIKNTIGNS